MLYSSKIEYGIIIVPKVQILLFYAFVLDFLFSPQQSQMRKKSGLMTDTEKNLGQPQISEFS